MKKYKFLALLILAATSLTSCSVHEVKSADGSNGKGASVVKISPFMARLMSLKKEFRENGIERFGGMEVINSEDSTLSKSYLAETDKYIRKMKMENALTVRDEEADVDIFVRPIPNKEGQASAMVIRVQEPDELTIVKMRGRFNFAKMVEDAQTDDDSGKKRYLGFISIN